MKYIFNTYTFYLCSLFLANLAFAGSIEACTSCQLSQVHGSPFITGSGQASFPISTQYSSSGSLLTVADYYANTVRVFPANIDCTLDTASAITIPTGNGPISPVISPNEQYVAVANHLNGSVSVFNIATQQPVTGSPYFTGGQPLSTFSLAYTPAGNYLAAANTNDGTIYLFAVQIDGSLIQQQIVTQPTGFSITDSIFCEIAGNVYLIAANRGTPGIVGSGSVIVYQLTTTLTQVGSYNAGSSPYAIAISPDSLHLAVANNISNDITVFDVAPDGTLAEIAGSPFISNGQTQTSISYSSDGSCIAVNSQQDSQVIVFEVDPITGQINVASRTAYPAGIQPFTVTYSPLDDCLAVGSSSALLVFPADSTSCALETPVSYTLGNQGSQPYDLQFSPNNRFLAATNSGDETVSIFAVSSTGQLSEIIGSPYNTGIGSNPLTLTYSPSGLLLAVTNSGNNTLSLFGVAQNGSLIPIAGSPFATGLNPQQAKFSPNGQFLAVTNFGDNTVSVFSVELNGNLTPVSGSPFATGLNPQGVTFSPNGSNLVVANKGNNTISIFTVSPSGILTPTAQSPLTTGANQPSYVAYSPDGTCLTVTDNSTRPANLILFTVASNGSLTTTAQNPYILGPDPLFRGPNLLSYSPDGKCLAVANSGNGFAAGSLAILNNNQCTVNNALSSPYLTGFTPSAPAYSPNGQFLAVANFASGTIAMYKTNSCLSLLAQAILNKYCLSVS